MKRSILEPFLTAFLPLPLSCYSRHRRDSNRQGLGFFSFIGSIFTISLAIAFLFNTRVEAGRPTPHPVFGKVLRSDGSVPEEGNLTFSAYIVSREADKLNEQSIGSFYKEGHYKLNTANFKATWKAGEILRIEFSDSSLEEKATAEIELNFEKYQQKDVTLSAEGGDAKEEEKQ